MPAIARVVGRDRENGDLIITVRVTGVGAIDSGGLPKRAKLRALIASGLLPDVLTGSRQTNVVRERQIDIFDQETDEETIRGGMPGPEREDIAASLDPEIAEGPISDVKDALDVIQEFGVFAQLTEIRELDTKGVVGLTPIKNTFGSGFVDIVNTAEYSYIITTRYTHP